MIFGTAVKVLAGFYIGCTGIITGNGGGGWFPSEPTHWIVSRVECKIAGNQWMSPDYLIVAEKDLKVIEVPNR